jgi:hypothetical protein
MPPFLRSTGRSIGQFKISQERRCFVGFTVIILLILAMIAILRKTPEESLRGNARTSRVNGRFV